MSNNSLLIFISIILTMQCMISFILLAFTVKMNIFIKRISILSFISIIFIITILSFNKL